MTSIWTLVFGKRMAGFHSLKPVFCPFFLRSFITSTANGNCIRVFKLGKREDSSAVQITPVLDFPKVNHRT